MHGAPSNELTKLTKLGSITNAIKLNRTKREENKKTPLGRGFLIRKETHE